MRVEKILKELTPERVKKEIGAIQKINLPKELQKWVMEYEKVGERHRFFWKWIYKAVQVITIPNVEKELRGSLLDTKFLMIMFVTLLDDLADKKQNKDLLNALTKIPFQKKLIKLSSLNLKEKEYLKFTSKVWKQITDSVERYPRYNEFEGIFRFDVEQLLNAFKYAYLVNENHYLINKTEYFAYLPNNMQGIISLMLDLMCSPKVDIREIGKIREVAWYVQTMARIDNWMATWEREIAEGDLSSGIFAYAINSSTLADKLARKKIKKEEIPNVIEEIERLKIEEKLSKKWMECFVEVRRLSKGIKTMDFDQFLSRMEKFRIMNLSSKGYI